MSYEAILEQIQELSEEEKKALATEILRTIKENRAVIDEVLKSLKEQELKLANNPKPRVLGLHAGSTVFVADDFDAELPDSFWLGEE